jgi:hypothetical protein
MSMLPVIKQDCQACPLRTKCWSESRSLTAEHRVINLLICRLKLDIKRETSTRLLLNMLQPKVNSIASYIARRCHVSDIETLRLEIQSAVIMHLMTDYQLGERAWPLHYLFAKPKGVITGWSLRYIEKQQRLQRRETPLVDEDYSYAAHTSHPDISEGYIHDALNLVEDGVTLSAREYRVFRFCLSHAGENNKSDESSITGLHRYFASYIQWDRSRVSRTFRRAAQKLIESTGHTDNVLGFDAPVDPDKRRARVLGLGTDALTADEGRALVQLAHDVGVSVACQAFGVHNKTYYLFKERYASTEKTDTRPTNSSDHVDHGVSS